MQLSAGEWAVLGLLVEKPQHGFALAKAMSRDGQIGVVWSLPRALVYRAITTLEAKGLVVQVGTERSDLGPQRRRVEATREGRALLSGWLYEPVEHLREVRSLLMLKLALLSRAGADPWPLLRAQGERFEPLLAALEERTEHTPAGFERALVLWRLESARAVIRFLDRAGHVLS